jgi:hypothetical protein
MLLYTDGISTYQIPLTDLIPKINVSQKASLDGILIK